MRLWRLELKNVANLSSSIVFPLHVSLLRPPAVDGTSMPYSGRHRLKLVRRIRISTREFTVHRARARARTTIARVNVMKYNKFNRFTRNVSVLSTPRAVICVTYGLLLHVQTCNRRWRRYEPQLRTHVRMEKSAGRLSRGENFQEADISANLQTGLSDLRETEA